MPFTERIIDACAGWFVMLHCFQTIGFQSFREKAVTSIEEWFFLPELSHQTRLGMPSPPFEGGSSASPCFKTTFFWLGPDQINLLRIRCSLWISGIGGLGIIWTRWVTLLRLYFWSGPSLAVWVWVYQWVSNVYAIGPSHFIPQPIQRGLIWCRFDPC